MQTYIGATVAGKTFYQQGFRQYEKAGRRQDYINDLPIFTVAK